jgi:hypothetical protein
MPKLPEGYFNAYFASRPNPTIDVDYVIVVCPLCDGSGKVKGKPIYSTVVDEEATGRLGWFAKPVYMKVITGYESDECTLCKGGKVIKAKLANP